jgi:hypothetical protein
LNANGLPNTQISNIFCPRSSLSVRDLSFISTQNCKKDYGFLYFNLYIFRLQQTRRQKFLLRIPFSGMWNHIPENAILHSHRRENLKSYKILIVTVFAKYFNFATFSKDLLLVFTLLFLIALW